MGRKVSPYWRHSVAASVVCCSCRFLRYCGDIVLENCLVANTPGKRSEDVCFKNKQPQYSYCVIRYTVSKWLCGIVGKFPREIECGVFLP